jgi:hypothetical protein
MTNTNHTPLESLILEAVTAGCDSAQAIRGFLLARASIATRARSPRAPATSTTRGGFGSLAMAAARAVASTCPSQMM